MARSEKFCKQMRPLHVRWTGIRSVFLGHSGSYLNAYPNHISIIGAGTNFSGPIRTLTRQYGCFGTYYICKNPFILQKNTYFSELYWGQLSNLNPSTDHGRPPIPSTGFPQVESGTSSIWRSAFGLSFAHKKITWDTHRNSPESWLSESAFSQAISVAALVMNAYFVNPRPKC